MVLPNDAIEGGYYPAVVDTPGVIFLALGESGAQAVLLG